MDRSIDRIPLKRGSTLRQRTSLSSGTPTPTTSPSPTTSSQLQGDQQSNNVSRKRRRISETSQDSNSNDFISTFNSLGVANDNNVIKVQNVDYRNVKEINNNNYKLKSDRNSLQPPKRPRGRPPSRPPVERRSLPVSQPEPAVKIRKTKYRNNDYEDDDFIVKSETETNQKQKNVPGPKKIKQQKTQGLKPASNVSRAGNAKAINNRKAASDIQSRKPEVPDSYQRALKCFKKYPNPPFNRLLDGSVEESILDTVNKEVLKQESIFKKIKNVKTAEESEPSENEPTTAAAVESIKTNVADSETPSSSQNSLKSSTSINKEEEFKDEDIQIDYRMALSDPEGFQKTLRTMKYSQLIEKFNDQIKKFDNVKFVRWFMFDRISTIVEILCKKKQNVKTKYLSVQECCELCLPLTPDWFIISDLPKKVKVAAREKLRLTVPVPEHLKSEKKRGKRSKKKAKKRNEEKKRKKIDSGDNSEDRKMDVDGEEEELFVHKKSQRINERNKIITRKGGSNRTSTVLSPIRELDEECAAKSDEESQKSKESAIKAKAADFDTAEEFAPSIFCPRKVSEVVYPICNPDHRLWLYYVDCGKIYNADGWFYVPNDTRKKRRGMAGRNKGMKVPVELALQLLNLGINFDKIKADVSEGPSTTPEGLRPSNNTDKLYPFVKKNERRFNALDLEKFVPCIPDAGLGSTLVIWNPMRQKSTIDFRSIDENAQKITGTCGIYRVYPFVNMMRILVNFVYHYLSEYCCLPAFITGPSEWIAKSSPQLAGALSHYWFLHNRKLPAEACQFNFMHILSEVSISNSARTEKYQRLQKWSKSQVDRRLGHNCVIRIPKSQKMGFVRYYENLIAELDTDRKTIRKGIKNAKRVANVISRWKGLQISSNGDIPLAVRAGRSFAKGEIVGKWISLPVVQHHMGAAREFMCHGILPADTLRQISINLPADDSGRMKTDQVTVEVGLTPAMEQWLIKPRGVARFSILSEAFKMTRTLYPASLSIYRHRGKLYENRTRFYWRAATDLVGLKILGAIASKTRDRQSNLVLKPELEAGKLSIRMVAEREITMGEVVLAIN